MMVITRLALKGLGEAERSLGSISFSLPLQPIFLLLYSITAMLQWIYNNKVPNIGDKSNLAVVVVIHTYTRMVL
jgi:hypothetical protein